MLLQSGSHIMEKLLSHPDAIMFIMVFMVPIVAILAGCWQKVRVNQSNNDLKQSMLERGMSAQEIEQVMNSGEKSSKKNK
jgi:hypothetical protein